MRHYCSFVVRVLVDDESGSLVEGQVRHVGSQEVSYFRSLDEITSFVRKHVHALIEGAGTDGLGQSTAIPQEYEID